MPAASAVSIVSWSDPVAFDALSWIVRFGGGKYVGSYGVVVKCTPGAANRPVVRLLFDAQGAPVPEGVEVDLRKLPDDAELTAVPEEGVSVEEYAHRLALARH